jgi:sulfoacetaldehyde acetyltransferase
MSLAEVMTAVQEDLPVLAVVFNNGQWGAEKRNQIDYYSSRFIGVDLKNPDYGAVARSMGADGARIESPADVGPAVRDALASGRPTVLDVMVDPEELAEPFRRDALKAPTRHLKSYGGQATTARG